MIERLAWMAASVVALGGCGDNTFGEGIRRPDTVVAPRPTLEPLAITEVDVAGSSPFVEILNTGGDSIALTGFSIATPRGVVSLDVSDLASGERLVVPVDGALLSTTSGEAALIDDLSVVHAYVSWGSAPGLTNSELFTNAFADGVILSETLAVPFPIQADDSLIFEGIPGCGVSTPGTESSATPCPSGLGQLSLTEFFPQTEPDTSLDAEEATVPWIEILNTSTLELDLDGVRVCSGADCAAIRDSSGMLSAGSRAIVFTDRTVEAAETLTGERIGTSEGVVLDCGGVRVCAYAPLGALRQDAELSLARPGSESGLEADLLSYARFSGASQELETRAVELGLWSAGDVAVKPVYPESYQRLEAEPDGPDAWSVGLPTP